MFGHSLTNVAANESDGRANGRRSVTLRDSARILCTSLQSIIIRIDVHSRRIQNKKMFRRLCGRWNGEPSEDSETLRYNEERPSTTSQSANHKKVQSVSESVEVGVCADSFDEF